VWGYTPPGFAPKPDHHGVAFKMYNQGRLALVIDDVCAIVALCFLVLISL
jgi:hypothetical protein